MPEHEFELYLALLAKTLGLSDPQRDEVVAELRDHMELRLVELMIRGMDHGQAVDSTLAELDSPEALARAFANPIQKKTRRRIMQSILATAAVIGLAAVLITAPDSGTADSVEATPPTAAGSAPAAVRVHTVADTRTDGGAYEIDERLSFYAHSQALIDHPDGTALPVLTAYGLVFSHEVPRGVFRDRGWGDDPYFVHPPEGVLLRDVRQDAEQADPADARQPLYAELSVLTTNVPEGRFGVTVVLYDAEDVQVGDARATVYANSHSVGLTGSVNSHALQKHMMDFGRQDDWDRVARIEVLVHDEAVTYPAAQELEVDAKVEAEGDQPFVPTTTYSRDVEVKVLTEAIAELDRSIDQYRRYFEAALADSEFATHGERNWAEWRIHSLQSLRSNLAGRLTGYMLSC